MNRKLLTSCLTVLIISLLLPTTLLAKSAQLTYWAQGNSEIGHTYDGIPFAALGAGAYVQMYPGQNIIMSTYSLPNNSTLSPYKVHFLETSIWALGLVDDTVIGHVQACYRDGTCDAPVDLIIGVNTAEWSYDRPENQDYLMHTKVPPAWSYWTDTDSDYGYWGHDFYLGIDTDASKILDHITLILADEMQELEYVGLSISAVTLETTQVPPTVRGSGIIPSGDDSGNSIFALNASWKEGDAWPKGTFLFTDPVTGDIFQAQDFRRFGESRSRPGATFLWGWGQLNGEEGYQFSVFVEDGGDPGAGNDWIRIIIRDGATDDTIYDNEQFLVGGNIIVKE